MHRTYRANEIFTGYPDGHTDADSQEHDLQHLKEKVEAGADFIITQLFYDVDGFLGWQKMVRNLGMIYLCLFSRNVSSNNITIIGISVPIIPGIAPIQSYASFLRMTKLCGTRVPDYVNEALGPIHVRIMAIP